jgi:hypothetical protein
LSYFLTARFMIEFMYINSLVLVYPNFENEKSFSTNHYEEGVHTVPDSERQIEVPDRTREQIDPGMIDTRFTVPLIQIYEAHFVWKGIVGSAVDVDEMPMFDLYHQKSTLIAIQTSGLRFKAGDD